MQTKSNILFLIPLALLLGLFIFFTYIKLLSQYIYIWIFIKIFLLFILYLVKNIKVQYIIILIIIFLTGFTIANISKYDIYQQNKFLNQNQYVTVTGKIIKIHIINQNKNIILLQVIKSSKNINLKNIRIYTKKLPINIYQEDIIQTKVLLFKNKKSNDKLSKKFIIYNNIHNISASGCTISDISLIRKSNSILRYTDKLRQNIYVKIQEHFGKDNDITNIISSLSIGYKHCLSDNLKNKIRNTGINHIFVISGLHFNIVTFICFYIINTILSSISIISLKYNTIKITSYLVVITGTVFLLLSGYSISSQRAYMMMLYWLISILLNKKINTINNLSITLTLMLLFKPQYILDIGFQLSFLATFILCTILNKKSSIKNNIIKYVYNSILSSIVINICLSPIIIYNFQYISLISPIVNIIVVPLVCFLILPLIIIFLIFIKYNITNIIAIILKFNISLLIKIINYFDSISFASINFKYVNGFSMFLLTISIIWFIIWDKKIKYLSIITIIIAIYHTIFYKYDPEILVSDNNFAIKENNNLYIYKTKNKYSNIEKNWLKINNIDKFKKISQDNTDLLCYKDDSLCIYKNNIIFINNKTKVQNKIEGNYNLYYIQTTNKKKKIKPK